MVEEVHPLPETITVNEFLELSASAAMSIQHDSGAFPASRNGIYNESETPVRTTSYWLAVLSNVYQRTGNDRFGEAADAAANYLLSDELRPYGHTFHSRNTEKLDFCDGLVGQSGPIRGLARAGRALDRPRLSELAKNVFTILPFSSDLGLWERIEINGKSLSFDRTLNHQIVFAAYACDLAEQYPIVEIDISNFLSNLEYNAQIHDTGLIRHLIRPNKRDAIKTSIQTQSSHLVWNEVVNSIYSIHNPLKQKELGYHVTNMVALAILYKNFPDNRFWRSEKFQKMISFTLSPQYYKYLHRSDNQYGSSLPLIDLAIVTETFDKDGQYNSSKLIANEINNRYDKKSGLLSNNAVDSEIQAASVTRMLHLDGELRIPIN